MKNAAELLKTFKEATQRQYDMWQGPTGSGIVSFHTIEVVAALESHARLLAALEEVNNVIYAKGAPLGSQEYFSIRTICCDAIKGAQT